MREDVAGPVAAEGGVEYDVVVPEMRVDVTATPTRELRRWVSPCRWIGRGVVDVFGNTTPREEPEVDVVARPLHSVDTADAGVEAVAVGTAFGGAA